MCATHKPETTFYNELPTPCTQDCVICTAFLFISATPNSSVLASTSWYSLMCHIFFWTIQALSETEIECFPWNFYPVNSCSIQCVCDIDLFILFTLKDNVINYVCVQSQYTGTECFSFRSEHTDHYSYDSIVSIHLMHCDQHNRIMFCIGLTNTIMTP